MIALPRKKQTAERGRYASSGYISPVSPTANRILQQQQIRGSRRAS